MPVSEDAEAEICSRLKRNQYIEQKSSMIKKDVQFDVLVIGAGINGLSAAYHLSHQKGLKIGVVEQFHSGHAFGSSHGHSRITRSIYANPTYIQLIQRARYEEWPSLEKAVGKKFIHSNPGCFFGRGKSFEKYLGEIGKFELDIEILEASVARRVFPQFQFQNIEAVICDHTAGVIAAQEAVQGLIKSIASRGVNVEEETKVLQIKRHCDPMQIITDRGVVLTKRLVITAGAWIAQLIPELGSLAVPIRQTVGYFKLCGPKNLYQMGRFPTWSFIGEGENQVFYGLPEFGCEGIKVAQHITSGKIDNPDAKVSKGDAVQIQILEKFIKENFVQPIDKLITTETCLYTNAPQEGFILDLLPDDERIAVGSACSGHGFKFAPLTGRILSDLVLHGKTAISEFEEARKMFSIQR